MTADGRFVPGAGACEIRLASKLEDMANDIKTLDRYAFVKFANSFEVIPRILSNNAGMDANDTITRLYAKNNGDDAWGIDIVSEDC